MTTEFIEIAYLIKLPAKIAESLFTVPTRGVFYATGLALVLMDDKERIALLEDNLRRCQRIHRGVMAHLKRITTEYVDHATNLLDRFPENDGKDT